MFFEVSFWKDTMKERVKIVTLYWVSDNIQSLSRCQCFQAYQIINPSGDVTLGCPTDRPIRWRVSFPIKTVTTSIERKDLIIS